VKIPEESAVLKLLSAEPQFRVSITRYQGRLVRDLVEITREGVYWIGLDAPNRRPDGTASAEDAARIRKRCEEFVGHAEQVALLGILSEEQAQWVQQALAEQRELGRK
jgi:hypothetical protein